MVIIFYDSDNENIYICTDREKMKIVALNDPELMSYIPNDDILYVQHAHFITKNQFEDWISGDMELQFDSEEPNEPFKSSKSSIDEEIYCQTQNFVSQYENSQWIHPAHNGSILIEDIKTDQFPEGVVMNGKWDFLPVEALGGFKNLEESLHYKILLAKGKIEVVDYKYVKKHRNKKRETSLADAALDAILIKDYRSGSASRVAAAGGIDATSDSDAIEIFVE